MATSNTDQILIRKALAEKETGFQEIEKAGVLRRYLSEDAQDAWRWIEKYQDDNGGNWPGDEVLVYEMDWPRDHLEDFPEMTISHCCKMIIRRTLLTEIDGLVTDVKADLSKGKDFIFDARDKLLNKVDSLTNIGTAGRRGVNIFHLYPKVLLNYDMYKSGRVGINTPFQTITESIRGWRPGSVNYICARPSTGKCIAMDSLVLGSDGVPRPIRDVLNGESDGVMSWNDREGGFESKRIIERINSGVKRVYRVKTRTGREVKVTGCHPFLTVNGWVKLDDGLSVGDCIASPRRVDVFGSVDNPDEAVLMAALIAEGNTTRSEIGFTNNDPLIVDRVWKAAAQFGGDLIQRPSAKDYEYHIVGRLNHSNPVLDMVRKWGLFGCKSEHKKMPLEAWSYNRRTLREFLRMLFSCDGSRTNRGVEYCTASHDLARSIQSMLLRFGIVAKLRFKPNACLGAWVLDMYGEEADRYINEIGFFGYKSTISCEWEGRSRRRLWDRIPKCDLVFDLVNSLSSDEFAKGRAILSSKGFCPDRFIPSRFRKGKSISRELVETLAQVTGNSHLHMITSDQIFWDCIVEIEDCGMEEVADLEIEGEDTHNFIANDLIVHNTWLLLLNTLVAHDQGLTVLFLSPELSQDELAERSAIIQVGLSYRSFTSGKLDFFAEKKLRENLSDFSKLEGFWVVEDNMSFDKQEVEQAIRRFDPDVIAFDSMYLFGKGRNRSDQIADASPWLKQVAGLGRKRIVFATAQMNRDAKNAETMIMSNIYGADTIAQDGDTIYAMFQDDSMAKDGIMGYSQLKVRNGLPHAPFFSKWDLESMVFSEIRDSGFDDISDSDPNPFTGSSY